MGYNVSTVGTQHFGLSQTSPVVEEIIRDRVKEQLAIELPNIRAYMRVGIRVEVEQESKRKWEQVHGYFALHFPSPPPS